MSTSYTNCDIEITMGPVLDGMETGGLDVDATERTAREMVQDALMAAFPQYSVYVYIENADGVDRRITRTPRDVGAYERDADGEWVFTDDSIDPEEFEEQVWAVVDAALESGEWYVETGEEA